MHLGKQYTSPSYTFELVSDDGLVDRHATVTSFTRADLVVSPHTCQGAIVEVTGLDHSASFEDIAKDIDMVEQIQQDAHKSVLVRKLSLCHTEEEAGRWCLCGS